MASPAFNPGAAYSVPSFDPKADYQHVAAPSPPSEDNRSLYEKARDNFNAATQGAKPGDSAVKGFVENVGAGGGDTIRSIGHALLHPIDTATAAVQAQQAQDAKPLGEQLKDIVTSGRILGPGGDQIVGTVKGLVNQPGRTIGQLGTGLMAAEAGGALTEGAAPVAGAAAKATGEAASDAGVGLMNKTIGTLKSDFKRGANPSRGYLETGGGTSASMRSIADKAAEAKDTVGQALSDAYKQATDSGQKIPVDQVADAMAKPIQKAIDLETGPGGTGNLAAIKSYVEQFGPAFDKASQNGGFTPAELFDIKRSIAQNTNWSDPAQFSLKSVRQQQTGALGGILSDAVPETADLNQHYQDLNKFVDRATERANTGSKPLTAHIYKAMIPAVGALAGGMEGNALAGAVVGAAMDSVPVKTGIASGLFRGGKALSSLGEKLAPSDAAAVKGVAAGDVPADAANDKNPNPQSGPPQQSNDNTSKWTAQGIANLTKSDKSITPAMADALSKTSAGKELLMRASNSALTSNSAIMKSLVQQAKELTK
jgi:hypothetical protein